jgi:DNA anti-recombination protein RmuC
MVMDDVQIIITIITFFIGQIIALYKVMDGITDRISKLEGRFDQVEKTLNMILQKMLDGDGK